MKPIDFITNPIVEETIWVSEIRPLSAYQKESYYDFEKDPKWALFKSLMRLTKNESLLPKWRERFLLLCAEGII